MLSPVQNKDYENVCLTAKLFYFFFKPQQAEQVRVNNVDSCTLQTTPRAEKITSREPSAVPALSPRKFPTSRGSLCSLPALPHTSRVQAEIHNGAANLPDNNKDL